MNVPLAVIFASFLLILITTNATNTNGLSALLGGYSGLLLGILFLALLSLTFGKASYLDMLPLGMILLIVGLILFYLITYFERISKGEVSGYYFSFSVLSTLFLFAQVAIILPALMRNTGNGVALFSNVSKALLGLIGFINILLVLTMGIVLKFYSTQG